MVTESRNIVRINHDGEPLTVYSEANQWHPQTVAQWSDEVLKQHELVLLVPASWVFHSRTSIASKNHEILVKSIPYAIEEELSNDVEDNYYNFKQTQDHQQQVLAIEKSYLDRLINQLKQNDLRVSKIHSEVDWLPVKPDQIAIWSDQDSSLMRFGAEQAMRLGNAQINQLLPVYAQQYSAIACNDSEILDTLDIPVQENITTAVCCEYLLSQHPIDLFLEQFKAKNTDKKIQSWRKVMWLVGLLCVSWVIIQTIQWYSLNNSIKIRKQQQINILKNQFPDAASAELGDPFAALQSRLQLQNSQSNSGGDLLIDVIDELGQIIQQQKLIRLNGLRLVDQKIELQIVAPSMTEINEFHQQLQLNANQYDVRIGVNELGDDNTFKSIITMVPR